MIENKEKETGKIFEQLINFHYTNVHVCDPHCKYYGVTYSLQSYTP